jgi:hypothetical protein
LFFNPHVILVQIQRVWSGTLIHVYVNQWSNQDS